MNINIRVFNIRIATKYAYIYGMLVLECMGVDTTFP